VAGSGSVGELVAERARRFGPIGYDEVLELALYHPDLGFYSRAGGAGRDGDFLTSPEVGPLFGAVLARALDTWWQELRRPDPFFVIEAGAGTGALAAAILGASPECSPALRYVLVERSEALQDRQRGRLPLEPARQVLGPVLAHDSDEVPEAAPAGGPLVTSLSELPVGPLDGVVLANELLDNLPFALLQRTPRTGHLDWGQGPGSGDQFGEDHGWAEVRVGEDLVEVLVPASPGAAEDAARLAPDAPDGSRIPLQRDARRWLRTALAALRRGRVVVVDYADTTAGLARRPWTDWVRTYRGHARGGPPLSHLGHQDVTCEVAVDQLAQAVAPIADTPQAEFLAGHGLDVLTGAARRLWEDGAAAGDLHALRARSRLSEAAALTDADGLGAFRVVEWKVP
jgi:SAM-dependent MidA family methyltransferase